MPEKDTDNERLNHWFKAADGCSELWTAHHHHDKEYAAFLAEQYRRIRQRIDQLFYPLCRLG